MTSERKIDLQMIKELRKNSEGDDVIADFLTDLIYEESNNSARWRWKKSYLKKVQKYSSKWRNKNENQ